MIQVWVFLSLALGDCFSFCLSACGKAALRLRSRFDDPAAGTRREGVTAVIPLAARAARCNSHSSGGFDTRHIVQHVPEVAFYDGDLCATADIQNGITYTVVDTCTVPGRELQLAPVLKNTVAQLRQAFGRCVPGDLDVRLLRSPIPKCWLPFAFS